MARRIIKKSQCPAISNPTGSSRRRDAATTSPIKPNTRNPTGVTITVQTMVLYQGSDALGVS